MKKKWIFLALFLIIALPLLSLANKSTPEELWKKAEKFYAEQTFKEALSYYKDYLAKAPGGEKVQEVLVKITVCHHRLRQYSESEKWGTDSLPKVKGTIWEARLYRVMGQHRFSKPHWGYKKKGQITWGRYVQGGQYVWTQQDDYTKAVTFLEKSRSLYMAQVERKENAKKAPTYIKEWIGTNMELSRFLDLIGGRWYYSARPRATQKFLDNFPKEYSPKFNNEEKILFLHQEAFGLAKDQKLADTEAEILYGKAMYLMRAGRFQNQYPGKNLHPALHPMAIFQELVVDYPKSKLIPGALLVMARMMENKRDYLAAKKFYKQIVKEHSKATWASDAQYYLREMEKERISFSPPRIHLPGKEPELQLSLRNMDKLSIQIRPFDLARFLNSQSQLYSYSHYLGQIHNYNLSEIQAYTDKDIHTSSLPTADKGDHNYVNFKLKVPVKEVGAYLLEIWGKYVHQYQLVVISDLTLVKKIDSQKAIVYVADSFTGKAVSGAEMAVKERYTTYSPYQRHVDTLRDTTNNQGLLVKNLTKTQRSYSSNLEAVAWIGKRFAISSYGYAGYYYGSNRLQNRFYTVTDRPVYRPGHKVNFKIYLRKFEKGKYFNEPSRDVEVRVLSPRGKEVYKKVLTTNENGAVFDNFDLLKKADLGMYHIYTRLTSGPRYSHYAQGNQFRVEEYKKPEYEVSVDAPAEQVQLGDRLKLKIKATYYFGAPVTGAKVTYRVQRTTFRHSYHPVGPWDWLYGRGYGVRYLDDYYNWGWHNWYFYHQHSSSRGGELIVNGKGTTNDQGELAFEVDTSKLKKDKNLSKWDHNFSIHAEVVDQSRRSIQGDGEVKVTRNAFYSYIFSERGFYTKGDKASFTLTSMTASSAPIKTSGILKIYRVTYTGEKNDKEVLTLMESQPLSTDHIGKGFFSYKSDQSGRFRMVFESKDKWGQVVQGVRDVWFVGDDFTGNRFKFGSLELLTDKRHYEEGETAHIMINTAQEGAAVLLCQEINRDIKEYQVLQPKGKSIVLDLKITENHVPNFFLSAVSIHGGQVHMQKRQVFAPPSKHMLKVKISTHKAHYRPGEKAKVTIETTDHQGNPVSTPLALAAVDQSVYYIQGDLTPDVRKFYYGSLRGSYVQTFTSYSFQPSSKIWDPQPNYRKIYPIHGMPGGWWQSGGTPELEEDRFSLDKGAEGRTGATRNGYSVGGRGGAFKSKSLLRKEMPSSAPAPMGRSGEDSGKGENKRDGVSAGKPGQQKTLKKPDIRKNFADTAFWNPSVVTSDKGLAEVEFTMPDSLTTWRLSAKVITPETSVGQMVEKTITRKDLLIRLQAPRFFTERDEVILSGLVHNYLKVEKEVTCKIDLEGGCLKLVDKAEFKVKVKPHGVYRANWKVQVISEGTATITMSALTDEESDAQQLKFPAYVHGIMKYIAKGGTIEPDGKKATVTLKVPKERKVPATKLELVLSPSLASAMLDALPYLSAYPYGCTEQTMSRFLPSVVTAAVLKDLGINLEQLSEKRKELNAQYLASRPWVRYRQSSATFSSAELEKRVYHGLFRLYSFQHYDGGWGWWRYGESDTYMTAYVTYGLYTAKKAGYTVESGSLNNALSFLKKNIHEVKGLYQKAYILFVLSQAGEASEKELKVVFEKRGKLNLYGKALLALSLHHMGKKAESQVVCRNIMDLAKEDKENSTAWFETENNYWWYWYNSDIETNAFVLMALSNVDPKNALLPKLVKWLLRNREGMRWRSTKTTAFVIYAMADYIRATGELTPDYTLTVKYQNKVLKKIHVTKKNALFFDNQVVLIGDQVPAGTQDLVIEKEGKGRLYFSVYLEYFTKEEGIKGAGNEIFINRTYTKLIPKEVERKVGNRVAKFLDYDRVLLKDGETLKSGDLVEVKLTIKAKNDYEYLMFEDRKPAGLEAVALKSGYSYAGGLCSNMELRDEKVVFFISWLQQGEHEITYKLRAEIPGTFHALPTYGEAMYAPKVKGTSDEWTVSVKD